MKIERIIMAALFVVATFGTVYAVNQDLTGQVTVFTSIRPKVLTTATHTGSTVDLAGFGACRCYISTGAYTDGSHTFTFEKSTDNSSWSACVNSDFIGSTTKAVVTTSAGQNKVVVAEFGGTTRYIRGKCVSSGVTTGMPASVFMVLGYPKNSAIGITNQ